MMRIALSQSTRANGLALGCVASLAELGPIVALLRDGHGLTAVLCAGLAYQAGGAAARFLPRGSRAWIWVATVDAIVVLTAAPGHFAWYIAIAMLAWALQATRRHHDRTFSDKAPSTSQKRVARVVGFVAASLTPLWVSIAVLTGVVLFTAQLCKSKPSRSRMPKLSGHPIEAIMVLHQIHYFSYCYALLLILAETSGGPKMVGIWFGLGWITYLSAEWLWAGVRLATALSIGHLIVASTLIGLALFGQLGWVAVLLWSLTGLGGGTVYCLTCIHRGAGLPSESLDVAEDMGHLGGVALAVVAVMVFGADAYGLTALGAAFALATPAAFLLWVRQGFSSPAERQEA